ncbi:MAG: MerR family transcriptional regulator [Clostridia bacterium]|nr:MerR family transcriptional regulator [Clostridia bacterium]
MLYRIGEVSKICDVPIKTLRYYEEFGLLSPIKVDIYTGYRYYDEKNIDELYKILCLKNFGFSLKEIKEFDGNFDYKISELEKKIKKIKKDIKSMNSLQQKGESKMKPFINDEKALGKWEYVCSCESKEEYNAENVYKEDVLLKNLYFLPNGEGYWIFTGWTKGEMFHMSGNTYKYEIEKDKLFLKVISGREVAITLVYEKIDDKKYNINDIRKKDNILLNEPIDENMVGIYEVVDYIPVDEKFEFPNPKQKLFFKSIILKPNGEAICEFGENIAKKKWTKNYLIDKENEIKMKIDKIQNNHITIEWKSGDYIFGGKVFGRHVFKKIK